MPEWLFVRALRYQWKITLAVFLCALVASYGAWSLGLGRRTVVSTHRAVPAPAPAAISPTAVNDIVPTPPATATSNPPDMTRQMQRWRAGIRYIDARIEETRAALPAQNAPADQPAPEPVEVIREDQPAPTPPSAEEVALRKSIAEQKQRLAALRAVDTDAHPDVIEAADHLRRLEAQLTRLERAQPTEPARTRTVTIVPPPAPRGPGWSTIDTEVQQEAMAHLADLIRQRAHLVTLMQSAAMVMEHPAAVPVAPGTTAPTALAAPAIRPEQSEDIQPAQQDNRLWFALGAVLASACVAFLTAIIIEAAQNHIAGPQALGATLPDNAMFLGTVPRMRRP